MNRSAHPSARRTAIARLAIGAAILLTGGIAFAASPLGAAGADTDATTFVPITPCRLFDTRPAPQTVGPRATPLGPADVMTVRATGTNGQCTIPADASGVAINATSLGATADSYATFYPADAERPHSSSLNYAAGDAPTPNSIDVSLSTDGRMAIFNAFGDVHLVGDVTGYYSRSAIQALNEGLAAKADASAVYTKDEIDAMLAGHAPGGYTDAEIDALLGAKADSVTTYSSTEVDAIAGAIASAVADKADSADVYTKAELDVLHQLLYTKDEVDDLIYTEAEIDALLGQLYSKAAVDALLVDQRVWLATVAPNGDEIGSGFTATRLSAGIYRVAFELAAFDFPSTSDPIFTALPRCTSGNAANTATFKNLLAGEIDAVQLEVETRNAAGALVDCGLHLMMRMT